MAKQGTYKVGRAWLYHRVSRLDQDPRLAGPELRAAALQRHFAIVETIEETGTGARNDRPGLVRVLEAARRGQIDALFVWKLDRFGRSAGDVLMNVRALRDAGVRFVCVSQGIDVGTKSDAVSQLILTVLAAVAEFELDLIRDRTRAGLAEAKKRGKTLGRPRRVDDDKAAQIVRLREEFGLSWSKLAAEVSLPASVVRDAYARRAAPKTTARRKRA